MKNNIPSSSMTPLSVNWRKFVKFVRSFNSNFMTKNEIIAQINLSLQPLNVNKVILFGSYARGTQSDDSDIDLLVVTNDNFIFDSFAQKMEIKLKISNALHFLRTFADIDLIVHTKPMYERFIELNSGFKKEILSTGSVIYEANN